MEKSTRYLRFENSSDLLPYLEKNSIVVCPVKAKNQFQPAKKNITTAIVPVRVRPNFRNLCLPRSDIYSGMAYAVKYTHPNHKYNRKSKKYR